MAYNFNAEDIIYNLIKSTGYKIYKTKAPEEKETGSLGTHIVINCPSNQSSSGFTFDAQTNLNIFVPQEPGKTVNRSKIKEIFNNVDPLISEDTVQEYCYIDRQFSQLLEKAKPGYNVFVVRYLLTIKK